MKRICPGNFNYLFVDEVIAELKTNPDAVIYNGSGLRMKLDGDHVVGIPGREDPRGRPSGYDVREAEGLGIPFAYQRR